MRGLKGRTAVPVEGPGLAPCLGPPHRGRFHLVAKSIDLGYIVRLAVKGNCTKATKVELYRQ